jgi:CRISPR-associated endonuclease Cas3-HD
MAYAHSANTAGQRHDLVEHLRAVAKLTAGFAEKLGAADAGPWLGLWHDLGKFHPEFQSYLEPCERPDWRREDQITRLRAGARWLPEICLTRRMYELLWVARERRERPLVS